MSFSGMKFKQPFQESTGAIPVVRFSRQLYSYLLSRLGRNQDLEDLRQEVYMRLLRMNPKECVRDPLGYLYTVAANVVNDYTLAERRKRHHIADDKPVEEWADDPAFALTDEQPEQTSLQRELNRALRQLPPRYAQILVMVYQDGLRRDEIAKRLGMSPQSIGKYLTRARAKMRELLLPNT